MDGYSGKVNTRYFFDDSMNISQKSDTTASDLQHASGSASTHDLIVLLTGASQSGHSRCDDSYDASSRKRKTRFKHSSWSRASYGRNSS